MTTILYIEDSEANRCLVRLIVGRREDLTLIEADSGRHGLNMAFELKPDIILLDLTLPDMNGEEVLDSLQKNQDTQKIPVIIVTGDFVKQGPVAEICHAWVEKPIKINSLFEAIDSAL